MESAKILSILKCLVYMHAKQYTVENIRHHETPHQPHQQSHNKSTGTKIYIESNKIAKHNHNPNPDHNPTLNLLYLIWSYLVLMQLMLPVHCFVTPKKNKYRKKWQLLGKRCSVNCLLTRCDG